MLTYLMINNYIWPYGCFFWCGIPKVFWVISLQFIYTDRIQTLAICLIYSFITNFIQAVMSLEIMTHEGITVDTKAVQVYSLMNLSPILIL